MQRERTIDHVEKQSDIPGRRGFPIQIEKYATDQFDPRWNNASDALRPRNDRSSLLPVVFVDHVEIEQFSIE